MPERIRRRIERYAYLLMVVAGAVAIAVLSWQIRAESRERIAQLNEERAARVAGREEERVERALALAEVNQQVNLRHCQQIEQLKRQFRDRAIEDYRRLDETLALLGLERTPEIERRAKESRDEILRRFRAERCEP